MFFTTAYLAVIARSDSDVAIRSLVIARSDSDVAIRPPVIARSDSDVAISGNAVSFSRAPINIVPLGYSMLIDTSAQVTAIQEIPTGLKALGMT